MKVSIITVTYNCISTIEQTITSVLGQKNADLEYIVIDGKSTDGTAEVIEKYADRIAFHVSKEDSGVYDAMNKGVKRATGDYILFLNGDDYLIDDTAISRISAYLDGESIVIGRVWAGSRLSPVIDMNAVPSPYYDIFYPHQATFVPKRFYDELGFFDESYRVSADFEWICRAIYTGQNLKWIDEIVSMFRTGGMSTSLDCTIDEYNISLKYLKQSGADNLIPDMTDKAKESAKNRIFSEMLTDSGYFGFFKTFLERNVKQAALLQLWGAGYLVHRFIDMLNANGMIVEAIIDKNAKEEDSISGIPVIRPENRSDSMILISTEIFDGEIARALIQEGLVENRDFIRHHYMRDVILSESYSCNSYIKKFEEKTKLRLM
jgi:glycosyltransferase involved in cell wall biosynthesis